MSNKVKVFSNTIGEISINDRSVPFKMSWPARGAMRPIEEDKLEQLMYNPGVEYMFKTGELYIEDMDVKKRLGLEPEDAKEPTNIIILTDAKRRALLVETPQKEFEKQCANLSYEQIIDLAEYAIDNKLIDFAKCTYIKNRCGRDIMKAISLQAEAART